MKYNRCFAGLSRYIWVGLVLIGLFVNIASADTVRQQIINLHKGWNAVFLEVDPVNPKPADCLHATPITMVASYIGNGSAVQYVQNPSTNNFSRKNGWVVWYAPDRPDAFLTQLFELRGNNPYLVYSTNDFTWSVTGNAVLTSVTWKPNSFTLAGFGLDDLSPPTFDQFFDGSAAHHPYRIYRLVNDNWVLVDQAQSTQMRSGESYWIFCRGSSDYQGPLTTKIQSGQTVSINGVNPAGVLFANNSKNPLAVTVANISGSQQLPLAFVLRAVTDTNVISASFDLPDVYAMPSFDAGESRGLWFTVRPEKMTADTQAGLLKITTDLGTRCWLPVTASRSDLSSGN